MVDEVLVEVERLGDLGVVDFDLRILLFQRSHEFEVVLEHKTLVQLELHELGSVLLAPVARLREDCHEVRQNDGSVLVELGLGPFNELVPNVLE